MEEMRNFTLFMKLSDIILFIMTHDSFCFTDNVTGDLHDILELNINNALKSMSITEHDTYGVLQAVSIPSTANSGVRSVYSFFFN
jgi:hypothetical protein